MKINSLSISLFMLMSALSGCIGAEDGSPEEEIGINKLKILALHGGGDSPEGLMGQPGMQDLMADLPEFEFFFADAPDDESLCNQCWYADPPGGKGA